MLKSIVFILIIFGINQTLAQNIHYPSYPSNFHGQEWQTPSRSHSELQYSAYGTNPSPYGHSTLSRSSNLECCKCYDPEASSSFIQARNELTNLPTPNEVTFSTTTKTLPQSNTVLEANERSGEAEAISLLLEALSVTEAPSQVDPLKAKLDGYYEKILQIFNLDLEILRETIDLIRAANTTVLPLIQNVFLPLMNQLGSSSSLNLENIIGNLGLVVSSATYRKVIFTELEDFKFLNLGPISFRDSTNFTVPKSAIKEISNMLTAEFDKSGLGFPIRAFFLGKNAFQLMNSRHSAKIISEIISQKLTHFIRGSDAVIEIKHGEIVLDALTPKTVLANNCEFGLTLGAAKNRMVIRRNTKLKGGGEVHGIPFTEPFRLSLITGGIVDLNLDLSARVHARVGKRIFGQCIGKMRKNLPLRSVSRGKAKIGVQLYASHVRIERRKFEGKPLHLEYDEFLAFTMGQKYASHQTHSAYNNVRQKLREKEDATIPHLVFKLNIRLQAQILRWHVNSIYVNNCNIRFFGVRVFSFCGFLKKKTQSIIEGFGRRTFNLKSPAILRRIESLFSERIGNEIAIPLLLVDENTKLIQSLLIKALTITSLKAELGRDLGELAGQFKVPDLGTYNIS